MDDQNNNLQVTNPFGSGGTGHKLAGALAEAASNREIAEVQSALVIAKRFPRDQKAAVDKILNACTRTSLAESAIYQYVRGGTDITGPSIRLAEAVAQNWGNILTGIKEVSRTQGQSECIAYAWDLETNYRDEKTFTVRHFRDTKKGGYQLTDERDIYELIANMGARRKRACILAVIPKDVVELAENQCDLTLKTSIEVTPELIKKLCENFEQFGVTKKQIETRIQRTIDVITPAQIVNMRKIFTSLRDGMSAVIDWFEPEESATPGIDKMTKLINEKAAKAKAEEPKPEAPKATGVTLRSLKERFAKCNDMALLKIDFDLIATLPVEDQEAANEEYLLALDRLSR